MPQISDRAIPANDGMDAKIASRIDEQLILSPAGKRLATTYSIPANEATVTQVYSPNERYQLLDQLTIALNDFYVHLNRKKAIYGFDPVRALALVRLRLDQLSDAEFHETVVEIVARIRDRHVVLYGRAPYGTAAILPFIIESCWIGESQAYIVTKIDNTFSPKALQRGAHVTHWNGIPIDRYLR
jgi:hypothetical protein